MSTASLGHNSASSARQQWGQGQDTLETGAQGSANLRKQAAQIGVLLPWSTGQVEATQEVGVGRNDDRARGMRSAPTWRK
jgi:hypothetical protein